MFVTKLFISFSVCIFISVFRTDAQETQALLVNKVKGLHLLNVTINPLPNTRLPYSFPNTSFIHFNGTKAELELTCFSKNPIVWDFKFQKSLYNQPDSFSFTSSREFTNFSDPSSYSYSADLKITLVTTPRTRTNALTCREAIGSGGLTVTSYQVNKDDQAEKIFKVEPLAEPVGPPVSMPTEGKCETIYFIQRLGPTKFKWNCRKGSKYGQLWYGKTWPCKTLVDCSNTFLGPPVVESGCVKYISADVECPGECATTVTEGSAVLQCRLDGPILPLVYSIQLRNGLPDSVFHWTSSLADLENMIHFVPIPSRIYEGEIFVLTCKVSMLYFANGTKFALEFGNHTDLRILNGEQNLFWTERNYVEYTNELKGNTSLDGLTAVYCLAPVWNTTEWVNVSYPLTFETGFKIGCQISNKYPVVSILPETIAVHSTPTTLLSRSNELAFHLNCSFTEPVQWKFNYQKNYQKYEIDYYRTFGDLGEEQKYSATLKMVYGYKPYKSEVFTCSSIQSHCLQTHVNLYGRNMTLVKVKENPDRKVDKIVKKCQNIFTVKVLPDQTFVWGCTVVVSLEIDESVSELKCQDPLTCASYFKGSVYQEECLKLLTVDETCEKCRPTTQNKVGQYYPLYLGCVPGVPGLNSHLYVFYSIKMFNNARKQYFRLSDADPTDMMHLQDISSVFYVEELLEAQCRISRFVFAKGAVLQIRTKYRNITQTDFNASLDLETNSFIIQISVNLTEADIGEVVVICEAPVINKPDRILQKTSTIVKMPSLPHIASKISKVKVTALEGESTSLLCDIEGQPEPNITWTLPRLDIMHTVENDSLILQDVTTFNQGIYKCTASNRYRNISKTFEVTLKDNSLRQSTIILIGLTVVGLVFIAIATVAIYVRKINKKTKQALTEEDLNSFINGVSKDNAFGLHETMIPLFCIPYNNALEIEREQIRITGDSVLGMGEFGKVYRGSIVGFKESVAIKTNKKNIDSTQFKAMLTEIKVMAHIGEHNNIVRFLGACTANIKDGEVYIAVELCEKGSLKDFLLKHRAGFSLTGSDVEETRNYENYHFKFSKNELNTWAHDIAVGMDFLESKNVIHGDLAARNILLTWDLIAKISDFGLSRQLANYTQYVKTSQCPLPWRWMAIEALQDMKFSIQSDVWSFGVTVWEIYTLGQIPYAGLSWNISFVDDLYNGLRLQKPEYMDTAMYENLQKCWEKDPSNRTNFKQFIVCLDGMCTGQKRKEYYIPEE